MRRLLLFLLAALSLVACTQNEVEELTDNRADILETLTVGFEGADDETRVQLQNSKTVWTKGDEVSVFYFSNANQRWQFQGETGERTGKLKRMESAEATAETTYNVVAYPYDSSYFLNPRTCALHATLPATQHYAVDSYGAGGNIMVAQSEFTQFSLKNVCGWLRVELTGEGEVVESVKVRGNNGEQVAGLIYVDTATADATLASEMGEASDEEEVGGIGGGLEFDNTVFTEVTLDCGEGVELGAEATAFYIALLPQTFEKGMTVEINYANGNSQPLVCENSITIQRNHISPIESEANVEVEVPTNQLWYTATALVEPYDTSAFNVTITSNEWNEATGEGIITFDGELTTIVYRAFYKCTNLTSVIIPDSVTTIGDWAFSYCESLTSVTIPDSVTTIGYEAFYDCNALTSVTIPDGVTTIGDRAFESCDSLTSITIGDSVTTIGNSAFDNCHSLTSVTIPDSVTTIENYAFSRCISLTSVTIGDSVTTIGYEAFSYCDSLTSVTIPDSVTTIGYGAFANCDNLAEFKGKNAADGGRCLIKDNTLIAYAEASGTIYTIPDSVTTIGVQAFYNCSSLTSVTIPDSVTTIGNEAFSECSSLTSVTIGDSVTTIGHMAFRYCYSLTSVTISDSITTIGVGAFMSCSSLTSVTIPDSVTEIGWGAFERCSSLAEFKGKFAEDGGRCLIKDNTIIAYAEASGTTYTIPDSVTTIGDSAFDGCLSLTSVTIPDSVTTIGNDAFYNCNSLTSVTIPDSVTTIGDSAFSCCFSLTSVTIGDSVTTIRKTAFYYCSNLTSVYCDATTPPHIDNNVFNNNSTDRKIYVYEECVDAYKTAWSEYADSIVSDGNIPESVTTTILYTTSDGAVIDASKFPVKSNAYNNGVGELILYGELKTIPDRAFYEFGTLTTITIPDSVTSIGERTFASCKSLSEFKGKFAADGGRCLIKDNTIIAYAEASGTTYTIPDSVTTIGNGAFYYCENLTSITIPDSVTMIGDRAFGWCSSLTSVTIPDSVTTIGDYAFRDCDSLTSITIGESVTAIGYEAFRNCSSLTSVTIPDSVTTIGDMAFSYCYSLTSVYCKATTPPTLGNWVFYNNLSGRKIYVPAESVEAYKAAAYWSEYAADIIGYDFETGEVVE